MGLSVVPRIYKVTTTEMAAKIQKKRDEEQLREPRWSGAKVKQWPGMGSIMITDTFLVDSESQDKDL